MSVSERLRIWSLLNSDYVDLFEPISLQDMAAVVANTMEDFHGKDSDESSLSFPCTS